MQLVTISDLQRSQQELAPLIEKAQGLSDRYFKYISSDGGGFKYETEVTKESTRASGIHASEASGCLRRLVYSIMDTERKVDSQTRDGNMIMRFRIGTAAHAMLQNDWERIAEASGGELEFTPEVSINPGTSPLAAEIGIYSSCDGIFTINTRTTNGFEPMVRVGLEIKTASKDEFDKLKEPKKDHIAQAMVYMACLDLPLMWLLYYNKSNSNFTTSYAPFLFKYNPKEWDRLNMRFAAALSMAAARELPDREESMACKWCPFSWTCSPTALQKKTTISPGMLRR